MLPSRLPILYFLLKVKRKWKSTIGCEVKNDCEQFSSSEINYH